MLSLARRLSALFLTLALASGQAGVCAGWMPTAEARMTCCSGHDPCPMHKSDAPDDGSTRAVSQAEADRCCALSDRDDAAPSAANPALATAPAVLSPVPVLMPEPEPRDIGWHAVVPIPSRHVAKHLLLSVLIV